MWRCIHLPLCLHAGCHAYRIPIYFLNKAAGAPGPCIEISLISKNGVQWREKSNSHLRGEGEGGVRAGGTWEH